MPGSDKTSALQTLRGRSLKKVHKTLKQLVNQKHLPNNIHNELKRALQTVQRANLMNQIKSRPKAKSQRKHAPPMFRRSMATRGSHLVT